MEYTPFPNTVAEFHSHGRMTGFFSSQDNRDEQGFKIYGVLGSLASNSPQVNFCLGIYGYFRQLTFQDLWL